MLKDRKVLSLLFHQLSLEFLHFKSIARGHFGYYRLRSCLSLVLGCLIGVCIVHTRNMGFRGRLLIAVDISLNCCLLLLGSRQVDDQLRLNLNVLDVGFSFLPGLRLALHDECCILPSVLQRPFALDRVANGHCEFLGHPLTHILLKLGPGNFDQRTLINPLF